MDSRIQKMAEVLVRYSVHVQPGEWVVIDSPLPGEPLAQACVCATLQAGGHPTVIFTSEDVQETVLREASEDQLSFISPVRRTVMEQADVSIQLIAPTNTYALSSIDPARLSLQARSHQPLSETFFSRWKSGELRWTLAQYPTAAAAQDAQMSLREYEDFVYGAALLHEPDPIAAWQRQRNRQQRLIDWLADKHTFRLTGPDTDLTLSIEGRTWLNDDGHYNFPGGEVFTSPIEDSARGSIQFTYPAYLRGQEVQGVLLVFEAGRVVNASATTNESFLLGMLGLDDGARLLGELALGTNYGIQRFSKNTLFDEKIGGTLHLALGRSVPDTGGKNESTLHWDMVYNLRDGSEVTVDGELFSRNGEFQV